MAAKRIRATEAPDARAAAPVRMRRFTARFPDWLLDALHTESKRSNIATNALVIEHLSRAVNPLNADVRDAAISLRLRAIEAELGKLETITWRQRVTLETVGVLAKTMLGYMREATTPEERRSVHARSERRFAIFAERVAEWTDGREQGLAGLLEDALDRADANAARPSLEDSTPRVAP